MVVIKHFAITSQRQINFSGFILATDLNPRSLNPKEYKDNVPIFEKIKALY